MNKAHCFSFAQPIIYASITRSLGLRDLVTAEYTIIIIILSTLSVRHYTCTWKIVPGRSVRGPQRDCNLVRLACNPSVISVIVIFFVNTNP